MPKGNPNAKPPKKRKSFGRNPRGGNKKQSNYDFDAARQAIALPAANHAQIFNHASVTEAAPASEKSPLKSVYKAMLKKKVVEAESLHLQNVKLMSNLDSKDKKISAQQKTINELASLLRDEKKKSRAVIEQLMKEADSVIAEASDIQLESHAKVAAAFDKLDRTNHMKKDNIHKERQYHSNHVASCESFRFHPY